MAQCQGARAQMAQIFFSLHQHLAERCYDNPQSIPGSLRKVNPARE